VHRVGVHPGDRPLQVEAALEPEGSQIKLFLSTFVKVADPIVPNAMSFGPKTPFIF
jgi:hypothetical protein